MKKKALLIFLFVLLGIASGFLTYKVIIMNKKVAVPDLKGSSPVAAMSKLRDLGLKLEVNGKDFDPVIPPGFIITQEPAAGGSAGLDSAVKVVLSLGPATPLMPSVLGSNLEEAVSSLEKSGLKVLKTIPVYSDNMAKGTVIAQDPNPGEKSGPVSLIVSNGPSEVSYYCPDFMGMSIAQAQNLTAALGLEPVFEGSSGVEGDQAVSSQKPGPGAKIIAGQKVVLFLGPPEGNSPLGGGNQKKLTGQE